jgi:hypothetical protein
MASETKPRTDGLGIWIRFWDLAAAFALVVAAFLMVRLEAIPQLRALVADKAYFTGKPLLLDQQRHGYGFETVRDHLRALGDEGRSYYAHSFVPIYDLALSLFLLTFMILFVLYATQTEKHYAIGMPGWLRKLLLVPPIVQFLFDVGENYSVRELMMDYPRITTRLVEASSQFTQWKWLAVYLNALIILGLAGFTIYRWMSPPPKA